MPKAVHALLAALVAAAPISAQAVEATAASGGTRIGECALRYAASLKRIGEENLPTLKAASAAGGAAASVGDPALPGTLLFVSRPRPRSSGEIAALTAAVALARSKGASSAVVGQDRGWLAGRLREDLGDYLNQKPTPYLCSGVKDYVRMLRAYAVKLGPVADHRQEWTQTQRAATERSLDAAFQAIRLARPAITASVAQPVPAATEPPASSADPSAAPPPAPAGPEPIALATPDDLTRAVETLVAAARDAGLVAALDAGAAPLTPAPPLDLSGHPVLAKLASEKPLVVSARPLIRDQPARLKVLAAFADIEMLDYLLESKAEAEDPVAKTLDRTLDDIEAARAADCTCVD